MLLDHCYCPYIRTTLKYVHHFANIAFFFLLPFTRLNIFLCCRIQLPLQSNLFSIFCLFSYISLSRQVHSTKTVASFTTFHWRIFIRHTLFSLHQSVNLLSRPVSPPAPIFQIFLSYRFCNNHTSKPITLIATITMIYSSFMMSTRQNINNFHPLLNATQINAVISINIQLHKTWFSE